MRILHIVPSLAPETGGPAQAVLRMCMLLAKAGNEVVLFTSSWPINDKTKKPFPKEQIADSFKILTFPSKTSLLMSRLPRSPNLIRAVGECSQDFDIILNHSLWNPLATFVMRKLQRVRSKYCLMPHGMLDPVVLKRNRWKKLPWAYLWERKNIEKASLIIFNTEAEEEKARQTGWCFKRTFVFPHMIDLSEWKEPPPRSMFESQFPQVKGREVVLFVGRINWVKNIDMLLEAMAIVRQRKPLSMLLCIGPDTDGHRAKLEAHAQTLGIQESLLFTGLMNKEDLKMAYARGDVLALVSQKENFGLVAAEALACGLPVVLSEGVDVGKDLPSEGPVRCVRPVPEEIAEAIITMLERSASHGLPDPEAQALAEKLWGDFNSSVKQLINAFKTIIAEQVH
jgi:glycosyltransferase involved in cell wall biosynthesis